MGNSCNTQCTINHYNYSCFFSEILSFCSLQSSAPTVSLILASIHWTNLSLSMFAPFFRVPVWVGFLFVVLFGIFSMTVTYWLSNSQLDTTANFMNRLYFVWSDEGFFLLLDIWDETINHIYASYEWDRHWSELVVCSYCFGWIERVRREIPPFGLNENLISGGRDIW